MPLGQDINQAVGDLERLRELLENPKISMIELGQALLLDTHSNWVMVWYTVKIEDISEIVKLFLDTIEARILVPLNHDPSHPLVQAAKARLRQSWAQLDLAHMDLADTGDPAVKTLQVCLDYILTSDQNKELSQRFFTPVEVNSALEVIIRQGREYPEMLTDLGNHLLPFWWQYQRKKLAEVTSQAVPVADEKNAKKPLPWILDETARNTLVFIALCLVIGNSQERFAVYGYLMQRPELDIASVGTELFDKPQTLAALINRAKIKPEEFDRILHSPLIPALEQQLSTNAAAAIELGEIYWCAWRLAVAGKTAPDVIATYLSHAITYLTQALYIDDKHFPQRALDLLVEIQQELAAVQHPITKHEEKLQAGTTDVQRKNELRGLEEEESAEKAVGAEQWLLFLSAFKPILAAQTKLESKVETEAIETEVQRRGIEQGRVGMGEEQLVEQKETTSEEKTRAEQYLQGQSAIQVLTSVITPPDEKESQIALTELRLAETTIALRYLEVLATANSAYASLAVDQIIKLLRQKFVDREDPEFPEGDRLPADPEKQLPELSALQAIQFLRNIPAVEQEFEPEMRLAMFEFFFKQHLQPVSKMGSDPREYRAVVYVLDQLNEIGSSLAPERLLDTALSIVQQQKNEEKGFNVFIVKVIAQKKVKIDFIFASIEKLNDVNKNQFILKQEIIQACLGRYEEMSRHERQRLHALIMPAPRNKGELNAQDSYQHDTGYTFQQLRNIFHCWCHRINHGEFVLHEVRAFLTATAIDIKLLQDISNQVINRDSRLAVAAMSVCAIGELHLQSHSIFESKPTERMQAAVKVIFQAQCALSTVAASIQSEDKHEEKAEIKSAVLVTATCKQPLQRTYGQLCDCLAAAKNTSNNIDEKAWNALFLETAYTQFTKNISQTTDAKRRLLILNDAKGMFQTQNQRQVIKNLYTATQPLITMERQQIIQGLQQEEIDHNQAALRLITNTLQRIETKLAIAEIASSINMFTRKAKWDIAQLKPKVPILIALNKSIGTNKFQTKLQEAITAITTMDTISGVTVKQLTQCRDLLFPPVPKPTPILSVPRSKL